MGKYLQHFQPCSCVAGQEKTSVQLQTEASSSQIASASVSCSFLQTRPKRGFIRPTPAVIPCDVIGFFFLFFWLLPFLFYFFIPLAGATAVVGQILTGVGVGKENEVKLFSSNVLHLPICQQLWPHLLQFWLPLVLFVHLCLYPLLPSLLLLILPISRGRLRNNQVSFEAPWDLFRIFTVREHEQLQKQLELLKYSSILRTKWKQMRRRGNNEYDKVGAKEKVKKTTRGLKWSTKKVNSCVPAIELLLIALQYPLLCTFGCCFCTSDSQCVAEHVEIQRRWWPL